MAVGLPAAEAPKESRQGVCRQSESAGKKEGETRRFGFPKANRLLKRSCFVRLSRSGRRVQNGYFILCHGSGGSETVRLGITVTKKIGNAVERNRIKRLCREFFRCNRHRMTMARDINLIAKRQVGGCDSDTIRSALAGLFKAVMG